MGSYIISRYELHVFYLVIFHLNEKVQVLCMMLPEKKIYIASNKISFLKLKDGWSF